MSKLKITIVNIAVCGLLLYSPGDADIRLPSLVSDNMVFQQNSDAAVWGWAQPGDTITVKASWAKNPFTVVADQGGRWKVNIPTAASSGPCELEIENQNGEKKTVRNILLGEVWVCSGQSNMQWPVAKAHNGQEEIKQADFSQIRLFTVGLKASDVPAADCGGRWVECNPDSIAEFSAVAYYFGRTLHQELKTPVGLINSSWGATTAEAWMPRDVLEKDFRPIIDRENVRRAEYFRAYEKFEKEYADWLNRSADRNDVKAPSEPSIVNKQTPSSLYNGMIHPLVNYAIKGVIWYQGEANSDRAYQYRALFPALISSWRKSWGQGDFPFYFVQIAPYKLKNPELREAQLMTYRSVSQTGMVVTTDIGDPQNIHPANKQDVGKRLALWALAKAYGREDVVFSGPLYAGMEVEGKSVRIRFDFAEDGLVVRNGDLKEFAIAGSDRKFVPAHAVIEGNSIVVSSPEVTEPEAVRYCWSDKAVGNLFNKAGLPASPFRTDDWPGETMGRE